MIVADTSAIVGLLDADDRHHAALRALYDAQPRRWLLPWAILPEVDYLAATHIGAPVAAAFLADLSDGHFAIEWGREADLDRAHQLCARYRSLALGLVDGVVMAIAERRGAEAIATLDLRHFGAVTLARPCALLPRDA